MLESRGTLSTDGKFPMGPLLNVDAGLGVGRSIRVRKDGVETHALLRPLQQARQLLHDQEPAIVNKEHDVRGRPMNSFVWTE